MIYSSSLTHIEDCFYEKRVDTSLNGYNDHHDDWISELDCLDRCLKFKPDRCRSFEHWRSHRHGLCVRANISLTDYPSSIGSNLFVDYYEVDCRKDTKAVRLQTTSCPGDQLQILVTLNGIDGNYVLLGDSGCKPDWSNETHAQFITHVDNCSLILTDGSIVGKLRWEGVDKDTNEARQYERFFLCPSDIYQIRLAHWTSTTTKTPVMSTSGMALSSTSTRRRSTPTVHRDEQPVHPVHKIYLQWHLHNRTYACPQICSMSLFSLIHVTFDDSTLLSSKVFVDSCDLIALYPYTNYVRRLQLIHRGCSANPTVIHLPAETQTLSTFNYSFYLYNILKEPIPFQIHCQIATNEQQYSANRIDCSSLSSIDTDQWPPLKHDKKDSSYISFHSSPVTVRRQLHLNFIDEDKSNSSNAISLFITVQHNECSLIALSFLIHWTFYYSY